MPAFKEQIFGQRENIRTAIPNSNGINRDRKTLTYRKL
jgi:hypothetical protein